MALLEGKRGLVVGIANDRSYAWYIAKALTEHGATCAFTHLPGEKNERRTAKAVQKLGYESPWLTPLDAGSDEQLDVAFERYAADHENKMDFLVHSIAFAERDWLQPGKFAQTPRQAYLQAVDVSAYTLAAMARRAQPMLAAAGGGSVICMSYYGGEKIVPGYNVMGVAKAALECTARYLADDLGADGTRVNVISGGYLRTLASSAVGGTDHMSDYSRRFSPLRRETRGEDVGGTAAWLVSDLSRGVTAETIYVDCGVNAIGVPTER